MMKMQLRPILLAVAVLVAPAFATGAFAASDKAKPAATKSAAKPAGAKAAPTKKSAEKSAKAAPSKGSQDITAAKAKGGKGKAVAKAPKEQRDTTPGPLAEFGGVDAPDDVVLMANYVSHTHDNFKRNFVIIDKKKARMYVFDPNGKLKGDSPVLLGKGVGDHVTPGIGTKAFKDIKPEEMTTPAGRFYARPGKNNRGEGIIWVDYKASVSMHRMRTVSKEQRRAERMDSPETDDNRISYGCINVPAKFYDTMLSPAAHKPGAFVYILPETRTPQQFFGIYDVTKPKG